MVLIRTWYGKPNRLKSDSHDYKQQRLEFLNKPKDCEVYLHSTAYQVKGYIKDSSASAMGHVQKKDPVKVYITSFPTEPMGRAIWSVGFLATEERLRGECITYHKRTTGGKFLNV